MQKLASTLKPQIDVQNKNVLVCAGVLVSYSHSMLRTMVGEWAMILRISPQTPDNAKISTPDISGRTAEGR